ncbi:uncharacterized protein PG986_003759 [Apiospora aurea]|uniref:HNH nuclease domain-containing protein n=1 Tax=Apiospora aurea TaxID=335848 RepID=A0ABR1QSJ8_9PEZI
MIDFRQTCSWQHPHPSKSQDGLQRGFTSHQVDLVTNQAPPRNEVPSDDSLPHTQKQVAAAEHIKQRLRQSIGTKRTTDHGRARALKDKLQLRLLLALLQCPDSQISGLAFAHESQHLYEPTRHFPRDILKDNQFICAKARDLAKLWMVPFDKDIPRVVRGWRCVFTHHTKGVEAARVIPDHITRLDDGNLLHLEAFTTLLSYFFPTSVVDDRVMKDLLSGVGLPNIIPLLGDSHTVWDQGLTTLRPVPRDPGEAGDEAKTMKLQLLQFNDEDPSFADCIYDVTGETYQADWQRRPGWDRLPPLHICTGDIYELRAEDPVQRPLPSSILLNVTCRMHQLRHAFKATGALRSLFREPPPEVAEDVIRSRFKMEPSNGFWENIIQHTMDKDILSEEDGWKWIVTMEKLDRTDEGL